MTMLAIVRKHIYLNQYSCTIPIYSSPSNLISLIVWSKFVNCNFLAYMFYLYQSDVEFTQESLYCVNFKSQIFVLK